MNFLEKIKKVFRINNKGTSVEIEKDPEIKIELKTDIFSEYIFPCKECIILLTGKCRELCNKVEMDNNKIKVLFETHECCPDCGCKQFFEGPCGGLSQNVICSNCKHKFNWALPLFIERIGV